MKVRIIQADGTKKLCPDCGFDGFRKSRKSRYTNKEKTQGEVYTLEICDKCGHRETYNQSTFTVQKQIKVNGIWQNA
jgi:ribosomal protein L37E